MCTISVYSENYRVVKGVYSEGKSWIEADYSKYKVSIDKHIKVTNPQGVTFINLTLVEVAEKLDDKISFICVDNNNVEHVVIFNLRDTSIIIANKRIALRLWLTSH